MQHDRLGDWHRKHDEHNWVDEEHFFEFVEENAGGAILIDDIGFVSEPTRVVDYYPSADFLLMRHSSKCHAEHTQKLLYYRHFTEDLLT